MSYRRRRYSLRSAILVLTGAKQSLRLAHIHIRAAVHVIAYPPVPVCVDRLRSRLMMLLCSCPELQASQSGLCETSQIVGSGQKLFCEYNLGMLQNIIQ